MPGPYNPPNPYGSYFTFGQSGDPASVGQQSFFPMPGGGLTPGAMNMAGFGSGGFNPTSSEYLSQRIQNFYQQQFMASRLRADPMAQTLTTAMLQQMYGSGGAAQAQFLRNIGGRGNLTEMMGTVLSFPGISGMIGGSPLALGQGAYALASSGGMNMNGRIMAGDGPMQLWAAGQIADNITRRFYSGSGTPILSMTSGLDRNQIGGLQMIMAQQGAFSGMNLMNLTAGGPKMDDATMKKIADMTKTAAKGLSSLLDIYGNATIAELVQKAQAITGLSYNQRGNETLITNRLSQLRQSATSTGMSNIDMMELAAGGVRAGQAYGLTGGMLFAAGGASMRAAQLFTVQQRDAGVLGMAGRSAAEINNAMVRDAAAMTRDPMGLRKGALLLSMESGHFDANPTAMAEARRLLAEGGPNSMARMDALLGGRGISPDAYIRMLGGSSGIQRALSVGGNVEWERVNQADVQRRMRERLTPMIREGLPGLSPRSLESMFNLIENFRDESVKGFLTASSGKALDAAIANNPLAKGNPGMIQNIMEARNMANPLAVWSDIRKAQMGSEFVAAVSKQGAAEVAANDLARRTFAADDVRGGIGPGGFAAGLLNRLTGNDPKTVLARTILMRPKDVLGLREGGLFTEDPTHDQMRQNVAILRSAKDPALLKAFGIDASTPYDPSVAQFQQLRKSLMNVDELQSRMTQAGRRLVGLPGAGRRVLAPAVAAEVAMEEHGKEIGAITAFRNAFIRAGGHETDVKAFQGQIKALAYGGDAEAALKTFRTQLLHMSPTELLSMKGLDLRATARESEEVKGALGDFFTVRMKDTNPAVVEAATKGLQMMTDEGYVPQQTSKLTGSLKWEDGKFVIVDGKLVGPAAK